MASREWFSLFEGRTTLQLQSLRNVPRASCVVPPPNPAHPRGTRRARVTLQALAKLVPLPPEIAELRSDFMERDGEHADGIPQLLQAEGSSSRSQPHDMFDLSGELELPSNDNRPVLKLGELERVMSFELQKVTVNTALPQELAELRQDLEELFPPELLGLSR